MATLELEQHPEFTALVTELRQKGAVDIVDHGEPVGRFVPSPRRLYNQLVELHKKFTSPPYPGNEVVDMRRESDR